MACTYRQTEIDVSNKVISIVQMQKIKASKSHHTRIKKQNKPAAYTLLCACVILYQQKKDQFTLQTKTKR